MTRVARYAVTRRTFLTRTGASAAIISTASCAHPTEPPPPFRAVARNINETIRANHFRPASLETDAYRRAELAVITLGEGAASADAFLSGFREIWRRGPFSHVALVRAEASAAERLAQADAATGGEGAVTLEWRDTAAILTVNTMSGADTIARIEAAFDEIVARSGAKLIIDLRGNTGGAFAVRTLIGHLIQTPLDAGIFVSRLWYDAHDAAPLPSDWTSAAPWTGYSVREFLPFMLARPLTAYRIEPLQPHFAGRVFVLTSARSLSAAEIAADAMRAGCGATIIGERTPGAVLSSKRFDIAGGFHLIVPVADYYSVSMGRLEGVGVAPDIPVAAEQALEIAVAS